MSLRSIRGTSFSDEDQIEPDENLNLFTYGGRIGIRFYLFTGEITYINKNIAAQTI